MHKHKGDVSSLVFILKSTNELITMPLTELDVTLPLDTVNIRVKNRGTGRSPRTGAGSGLVLFIGPSKRQTECGHFSG